MEAWNSRDVDALVELADPDCGVLVPPELLNGDTYYGHEGLRAGCAQAFTAWETLHFEMHRIRNVGERVALLGRLVAVSGSGASGEAHEAACILRVRDGKIVRARILGTADEAMSIMGLRD